MLRFSLPIAVLFLASSISAHAQESESRIKIEEKAPVEEDIDDVITNPALRAESGSKSKWSIGTALNYNGGTVQKPFSDDRPNVADSSGITNNSSLEGSVSVKHNLSAKNSLSAGIGLRYVAPLESKRPKNYEGDRLDASNPYLLFQRLYAFKGVQSVFYVEPTLYTNSDRRREGYVANVLVNQDNIIEIGSTGISAGFSIWAMGGFYNKSGPLGDQVNDPDNYIRELKDGQSDYQFGLDPVLEYAINDRFNIRTLLSMWTFEHFRSQPSGNTYVMDTLYGSVGLGISVTRDIFLYPNVQFAPEHLRADHTNVGLNTNINLF